MLEVKPYLYDLDKLLSKMSEEIVKGIKANSTTSLEVYITIRSHDKEGYIINGQAMVTDYDRKPIGRCLLLKDLSIVQFSAKIYKKTLNINYLIPTITYQIS
jgi:5'(3')-deoxyribonucleotidase